MSPGGAAGAPAPPRRWTPEAAVAALIAVTAAARVLIAWATGLCFGESYYFSCALHPSLSYFDHPPLSILIASLSFALGGEPSRLLLRAPFIALFAGTTWLLFLLGRRLFGAWAGFWAALLLNLSPIFTLSVGLFFQPEGPLMFFWVACAWCLAHVLLGAPARRALRWWAAAGAMLGLGMLSKYAAVLLVAGAGLYVPRVASNVTGSSTGPTSPWRSRSSSSRPSSSGMPSTAGVFIFQSTRGVDTSRASGGLGSQEHRGRPSHPAVAVGGSWSSYAGFAQRPSSRRAIHRVALGDADRAIYRRRRVVSTSQTHFQWRRPGISCSSCDGRAAVSRVDGRSGSTMGARRDRYGHRYYGTVLTSHIATGWLQACPCVARPLRHRGSDLRVCRHDGAERSFAERGSRRPDVFVFSDCGSGRARSLRAEGDCRSRLHRGDPRASRSSTTRSSSSARTASSSPPRIPPRLPADSTYFARNHTAGEVGSGGGIAPSIRSTSTAASGSRCPTPSPMGKPPSSRRQLTAPSDLGGVVNISPSRGGRPARGLVN